MIIKKYSQVYEAYEAKNLKSICEDIADIARQNGEYIGKIVKIEAELKSLEELNQEIDENIEELSKNMDALSDSEYETRDEDISILEKEKTKIDKAIEYTNKLLYSIRTTESITRKLYKI